MRGVHAADAGSCESTSRLPACSSAPLIKFAEGVTGNTGWGQNVVGAAALVLNSEGLFESYPDVFFSSFCQIAVRAPELGHLQQMSAFSLRRPVRSTLTVPDNRENVYHRRMLLGTPSRQNPFSPGHTCTPGFLVTFVIPFGSFPETRCSPFEKFACFHAGSMLYSAPGVF